MLSSFRPQWPTVVAAAVAVIYFVRPAVPPSEGDMHLRAAAFDDVPQIAALVAPRPITLDGASDRAQAELAPLATWYATLGAPAGAAPVAATR